MIPPVVTIIVSALLAVPMYVCGGSTMPVLSSLIDKGLPTGAALAFVIVGPATRLQVLAGMKSLLNKRAIVAYITLILLWASIAGGVFELIH